MRKAAIPRRAGFGIVPCFVLFALAALLQSSVSANPSRGVVRHGDIRIRSNGDALRIIQNSNRGIIDWNSFSIQNGQTTRFVQPNSRSATLNRVTGASLSRIDGRLRANGQVFLLNPNGVVVGRTGSIDVAGFTASTLDLNNEEFLAGGDLHFRGNSQAAVVNLGDISAFDGDIFLVASTIDNAGSLRAPNGTVGLAAGNDVLIRESGSERVFVRGANGGRKENGVVNRGTVEANVAELKSYGGNVYGMAVKNEGRVSATGVTNEGGQIFLRAGGGKIRSTGRLTAKRPSKPKGGNVVVDAGRGGTAEIGGSIDVGSARGVGGNVLILGDDIAIFESSLILADGDIGGGAIKIGGGRSGGDSSLSNATNVNVGEGALLNASAGQVGNGGEVIVFAEGRLDFQGHAAALGGALGGNGGFVELSGKEEINLPGLVSSVDVSASSGDGGTFLLDPTDIYIIPQIVSAIGPSPVSDPTILDSDVSDFLQNVGSLIIQTDSVGTDQGNIYVDFDSGITWNSASDLTLNAHGQIIVSDGVSFTSSGTGGITFEGQRGIEIGSFSAFPGMESSISTQVGNIVLRSDSIDSLNQGVAVRKAMISTSGGNISIFGNSVSSSSSGVDLLNASLSTGSGKIDINGRSEVSHGILIQGTSIVSNGGGDIDIYGRAVVSNFSHDGIRIDDTSAVNSTLISTRSNANITLTGEGTGEDSGSFLVEPGSEFSVGIPLAGSGFAIRFEDPVTAPSTFLIDGDGTQNVALESMGGDIRVTRLSANEVKFNDPDGVGQHLEVRDSSFNFFTAVNVGSVDVEVDSDLEIGDIKLATDARFFSESGSIGVTGNVDAGRSIELSMGAFNGGDIELFNPLISRSKTFNGSDYGTVIRTHGVFDLHGVTFNNIYNVEGVGSGNNMLVDSELDSLITLRGVQSTFPGVGGANFAEIEGSGFTEINGGRGAPDPVVEIRGVEFSGYQAISGAEGDDTFAIMLDENQQFDGVLHGGAGQDKFLVSPGGRVQTVAGGAGIDTIDYSLFTTPVTADFAGGTSTQIGNVQSMEGIIGGQGIDTIRGTPGADTFEILADAAGRFNGKRFQSFEILGGAGGNDHFLFRNQATVNKVYGGSGIDRLTLNDRNLGGVNTYTISHDTISRNPSYTFSGVEALQLLLGPGDDTVKTRGNGLTLLLDGGRGFDTLEMGRNRFLRNTPFVLGGSTIVTRNFEAPYRRTRPSGGAGPILTTQTNNVPVPNPNDGPGGEAVDEFTGQGPGPASTMGPNSNPAGNAFGAAAVAAVAGQAVVIMVDGEQYLLGAPASLDGGFTPPPIGVIKDLRETLSPEIWSELADSIDFEGGMVLVTSDGAYSIDLTQVPPADIVALLMANLDFAAALELSGALELTLSIPITSDDGAVGIALVPIVIDPAIAALLGEILADEALAELTGALDSE